MKRSNKVKFGLKNCHYWKKNRPGTRRCVGQNQVL